MYIRSVFKHDTSANRKETTFKIISLVYEFKSVCKYYFELLVLARVLKPFARIDLLALNKDTIFHERNLVT